MSNYHKDILSYFSKLDIDSLKVHLQDGYSYQDTTKEIFLEKIEEVFISFKNAGDTELLVYKGTCCSEECENSGKTGYRFVGNHSKNHLSLIFMIDRDEITDIFICHHMHTAADTAELKKTFNIRLGLDDDIKFNKSPEYYIKVNDAVKAYAELFTNPTSVITFEELCYWLDKNNFLNAKIGGYTVFKPLMKWTPFTETYAYFSEWRKYIEPNLEQLIEANKSLVLIKENEEKLIEWVLKYDRLFDLAPFDIMYMALKNKEIYTIEGKENIHFIGNEFQQAFDFTEEHQKHQNHLLKKYNTLTKEELRLAFNESQENQKHIDLFKLSFHLEHRRLAKELGIEVPFNIPSNF